jgi:hypothetical protein
MALNSCCEREALRSLKKHRDVAICDGCGHLLLAWNNEAEQAKTRTELEAAGVDYAEAKLGGLFVTAKARN